MTLTTESVMIEIKNAEKSFTMHLQGGIKLPAVRGVSFDVHAGECVVLSGPSGAGKSSILKMIFGNYRCDGGLIAVRHEDAMLDIAKAEPRQILNVRRSTIGYVSQFLRAVPRVPTVDVVAEPLVAMGAARVAAHEQAGACCAVSTFPNGCGRFRPRPFPAASSNGSISRAASSRTCLYSCLTSRPHRSMPPIAKWWWI